ncbi:MULTISPECIES: MCE family protein [Nocardia]|uniref:MCE family protein n=1 Tax=Nocardia salmonicida TaxID=53431 RepID=A0ABZ1MZS9_9NOCA|nr:MULTISPECIES: MCE family protein [Nocardia]KQY36398.1 mammalian cell entry protein [Nocardia sp. Root136]
MNSPLWEWLVRRRIAVANAGLVVVLLLGSGYLGGAVLRIDPTNKRYAVTVELAISGGLTKGSDVTFRGVRVGRVDDVRVAGDGIAAVAEIEEGTRIPLGGTVAVARLSAAGEQYLDFRPETDTGPYLRDGSVIARADTGVPVQVQSVLLNMSGLVSGLNPERLNVIVNELDKALAGGPDGLRNMISGISRAMAGLNDLLPQTEHLLRNLEVIASTTANAQPDLGTLTNAGSALFQQFSAADAELRHLLQEGPGQLATLGGFISRTQNPITDLVTNFVAITRAAKLRQPAIELLFPTLSRFSEAVGIPAHDNAFYTLVDPWPRPTCDYDTVPILPTQATADTRVRLYNYCVTDNPALQVRGSANAPRPAGPDNGAGPPPGVTGDELSQPSVPAPR